MSNKTWIEKAITVIKFVIAIAPYVKEIFDLINSLADEFDKLDDETQEKVANLVKVIK